MRMTVIGLDMATLVTGVCITDGNELIFYEKIIENKDTPYIDRIKNILNRVKEVIEEYRPTKAFIEDAPIMKNSSASMLCVMQGYFLCMADNMNLPVDIFQPSSWRKTLGIIGKNGREALKKEFVKSATVDYVNNKFGTSFVYSNTKSKSDDDITDAIGVACCGILR